MGSGIWVWAAAGITARRQTSKQLLIVITLSPALLFLHRKESDVEGGEAASETQQSLSSSGGFNPSNLPQS